MGCGRYDDSDDATRHGAEAEGREIDSYRPGLPEVADARERVVGLRSY